MKREYEITGLNQHGEEVTERVTVYSSWTEELNQLRLRVLRWLRGEKSE